jgi:hypothetical protein
MRVLLVALDCAAECTCTRAWLQDAGLRLQGGDALCRHEASRMFFIEVGGHVMLFVDGLEFRAVPTAAATQAAVLKAVADHALLAAEQVCCPLTARQ